MKALPQSLAAALLLVGAIVGAGMFAIPFVFVQAGFLTGALELLLLAALVTLVHLAYAEVVVRTPQVHRLPGYARLYLGPAAAWLSRLSYLIGISGALLAYLILGGAFLGAILETVLPGLPVLAGPAAFYLIGIGVVLRGIRFESFANALFTLALIAAVLGLGVALLPHVSFVELAAFSPGRFMVPYGVLLFALAGSAIIPDIRRVLGGGRSSRMAAVVIAGTLVSAALYLLFAVAVAGTTGDATTPDAISGVAERFGPTYGLLGAAIGFLAAITSFITLAVVLEGMFTTDFGMKLGMSTTLTASIPLVLFAAGLRDFVAVIGLVGAVAIGIDSILILAIHRRAQTAYADAASFRLPLPGAFRVALTLLFVAGVVIELVVVR